MNPAQVVFIEFFHAIRECRAHAVKARLPFFGIALLLSALQGAGGPVLAMQARGKTTQDRTIKVRTELAEVRAVVTDRKGRFIENLGKDDFELRVNRKPRAIDHFSHTRIEDITAPAPTARAAAAGVETKRLEAGLLEAPARTVLLFVDTLHLSFSSLALTRQALLRFVDERLTERDRIALVTSSWSRGMIAEQFTRDRTLLRYAIEKISPGPMERPSFFTPYLAAAIDRRDLEALGLAIALLRLEEGIDADRDSMAMMARARARQILSEASYKRRATLHLLKELAATMADLPGQRMIVLFSDGFTMYELGGYMQPDEIDEVTRQAARSGVAIYSIDAKGLQPPAIANALMSGGAAGWRLDSYLSAHVADLKDGMHSLAADTGGEMYGDTNDLGGALGRVFEANKSYYVLAYYLDDERKAGRFSSISVRVKGHPEYVIRAPKGFSSEASAARPAETEETREQRVRRALQAPLPRSEIVVSASAAYFETDKREGQVTLVALIEGDALQYREQDQRHLMELEVASTVFDASGKQVLGYRDIVQGNLASDRLAVARQYGYRFAKRLSLKPGVYQLRVAVLDAGTEHLGTAFAWIEVPDLARSRFALSSLILDDPPDMDPASSGSAGKAGAPSKMYQDVRLYPAGAECAYTFRIQKGAKGAEDAPFEYRMDLIRGGKTALEQDWQPAAAAAKDSKGISVTGRISLAGLASGIYELRVTARESRSNRLYLRTAALGIE